MKKLIDDTTQRIAEREGLLFWLSWVIALSIPTWDMFRLGVVQGLKLWSVGPVGKWALIGALILMAVSRKVNKWLSL